MEKKTITFLIVSNRKGTTKRITFSAAWLKASAAMFMVAVVISAACAVDYVGLLAQSIENRRLRAENEQLKQQFQVVEGKVNSMEVALGRLKSLVVTLKTVMNVGSDDRVNHLAMGPLGRGESLDREPSALPPISGETESELAQDSVFFQKPPVDELQGELVVEGQRDYASLAVRIDQAIKETGLREQSVTELMAYLDDRESLIAATPRMKPVKGWFTSKFGYRLSPFTGRPVMHNGLDIAAAPGAPIMAPADGVVSFAGYDSGYGKLVSIDHGYGVITRFGHTSQLYVQVGQKVKLGDVIAAVGNTGRSTGPHLHYEVRVNNIPVDPQNYVIDEYF